MISKKNSPIISTKSTKGWVGGGGGTLVFHGLILQAKKQSHQQSKTQLMRINFGSRISLKSYKGNLISLISSSRDKGVLCQCILKVI